MYGKVGVLQMNQTNNNSKWTEDWINIQSISNFLLQIFPANVGNPAQII